jgi:GTP cyclohydrolase I
MKTRHHIVIRATCPVDNTPDKYDGYVYVNNRVLTFEEVAAAVEALTQEPVFQERLTQALADRLQCRVKTRGRHVAGGIVTTCVCEPRAVARR